MTTDGNEGHSRDEPGAQAESSAAPLADELLELRRRVAELEERARRAEGALADSNQRFARFTEITRETVAVFEKGIIIDLNPHFEAMFRCPIQEAIGKSPLEFTAPESRDLIRHHTMTGYEEPYEAVLLRKDNTTFIARVHGKQIDYQGRRMRVVAFLDITAEKEGEAARRAAAVQEEVIRTQAAVIAALSTPILPLSERVLLIPLIGEVNEARAAQVIESLARGVFAHRAALTILDITGVTAPFGAVAEVLARAARVVGLLGAEVVLTGVSPAVAEALVGLGVDLQGFVVRGTLQQGVAYALARSAQELRGA